MKHMKNLIRIVLLLAAVTSNAQQISQQANEYKLPENIVEVCKDVERFMIQGIKMEREVSSVLINIHAPLKDKSDARALLNEVKRSRMEDEERWYKLGCVSLL